MDRRPGEGVAAGAAAAAAASPGGDPSPLANERALNVITRCSSGRKAKPASSETKAESFLGGNIAFM